MKAPAVKWPASSRRFASGAQRFARPQPEAWARAGAWTGALGGALLAALFFLPAAWLAQGVAEASRGQVLMSEPRGTFWSGSAEVLFSGGSGSRDRMRLPGRLHWSLSPQWLSAGLDLKLRADCCTPEPLQFMLRRAAGAWQLQVADTASPSVWPTALLAGLGTPWNTLQPTGTLRLAPQQLKVRWAGGRWQISGRAELELRQFASGLSTLRPLGSYRLRLTGGEPVQLSLDTIEGGLRLSGSGQWSGSRLRFAGEARAEPGLEAALDNFLNVVGRRDGPRSIITLGSAS